MALTAVILGLHAVQAMFALVLLGLSAYLIMWFNTSTLTASPPEMNWQPFSAAFAILSIGYLELAPRKMARASHPYALIAVETTNMLFFLGGFIAIVTFMMRIDFCNGMQCDVGRAATAFSGIQMLLWVATCVLTVVSNRGSMPRVNKNPPRGIGHGGVSIGGGSPSGSTAGLTPPQEQQKEQLPPPQKQEQQQQMSNVPSGIWTR